MSKLYVILFCVAEEGGGANKSEVGHDYSKLIPLWNLSNIAGYTNTSSKRLTLIKKTLQPAQVGLAKESLCMCAVPMANKMD